MVIYTSGTTGMPKGVMLSHHNLYFNAKAGCETQNFQHTDVALFVLPLNHSFGIISSIGGTLYGVKGVLLSWFDAAKSLELIERYRCSYAGVVPTMLAMLLNHPDAEQADKDDFRVAENDPCWIKVEGLVGASLACALAPLNLRVALLEAVAFRAASQPSYDDRTLALSASTCRILEGLGLWPKIAASATPIREIQVRELGRPGRVIMDPAELGLDRFGNVVEARVFGGVMMDALPGLDGVDFLCPARVTAVTADADRAQVDIEGDDGPRRIEARLLVGADGAQSFVRDALGIEAERHDYGQSAVICNVTPEQDHRGRAFELFTPSGPLAVMPHVEGRCGLMRTLADDLPTGSAVANLAVMGYTEVSPSVRIQSAGTVVTHGHAQQSQQEQHAGA